MTYDYNLISFIKDVEKRGAGEILLNSVDRDGSGEGYDHKLIKTVNDAIKIPLIPCGGVGRFEHFADILDQIDLSALAEVIYLILPEKLRENKKIFERKKI